MVSPRRGRVKNISEETDLDGDDDFDPNQVEISEDMEDDGGARGPGKKHEGWRQTIELYGIKFQN